MKKNQGFTLVEILIVVIILGILAAIVIPQFTEASNDARESALQSDLQTVRSQLQLYRVQHLEKYPTDITGVTTSAKLVEQMTSRTDATGAVMPAGGVAANFPFGPYLQKFPTNAFVSGGTEGNVTLGTADAVPADGATGWYFNTTTGKFSANSDGTKFSTHANW